ncbi:MAG: hypothetical protein R3Y62_07980 [Eubacteriales bacterium]
MVEPRYSFTPAEQKTSIIQITKYQEQNFEGFLENLHYSKELYFANLTQLLMLIEQLQDDIAYPQRGMEPRSFKSEPPPPPPLRRPLEKREPPLATFQLRLLFRQNASWQGSVTWVERRQEANFRSTLELVLLMDSVLS